MVAISRRFRRQRSALLVTACLALASMAAPPPVGAQAVAPSSPAAPAPFDLRRFEQDIVAFENADRTAPPTQGGILFVGSSIFRLWTTLQEQMAPLPVLNRAFGGSRTAEQLHYFDRVVLPYRPRLIVYYCGSNDINAGYSAESIADNYERFSERVRRELPGTQVYFASIIRAPQKRDRWDVVDDANARVQAYSSRVRDRGFIDLHAALESAPRQPREDVYLPDRLHYLPAAYERMSAVVRPVVATAWAEVSAARSPAMVPDTVPVFRAGEHGYHTFRIPAIVRTPKGELLAFAEGRRNASADAGDIDLVARRSTDGGRTWSALQVIGDDGADTFGNPCVVVDRDTGVIWLFVIRTTGSDKEQAIIEGRSRSLPRPWVLSSADGGVTWSAPVDLTSAIKRSDWTWYSLGPGIGIQLRDGRLVIPGNHAIAGSGVHRAHLVTSADHGKTWQIGAVAVDGTNESQVVELSDGRVLHNMRNHPPKHGENHRAVATSADGGRTLSPVTFDPALIEPPAQASILAVAGDRPDRRWIVFSNPASTRRERMTVRLSDDDGATWRRSRVVYDGPSAYSCLVELDGDIGLLYERGEKTAYESIVFTRLTRAWLDGQ